MSLAFSRAAGECFVNFAELRFWQYLGFGLALILLVRVPLARLRPALLGDYDRCALACLGLGLLAAVSWLSLGIFICVLLTAYLGVAWTLRRPASAHRGAALLLGVLVLLPLLYFKYADFFGNQVLGLGWSALGTVAIPVGISFYSFQKVAFVADTLAFRRPLPKFLDFVNFAAFFPQIVAGPIERRADLMPQVEAFRFGWSPADLDRGAGYVALGMFFKLALADNLAAFVDPAPADNGYLIWAANFFFGLRIYYDFAGYSLIAVGLAQMLGIRLTLNFRSPYCAGSVVEFWRRWHVTLSQWFRDYVYQPLGGGGVRWWWANVLLVFVVSGIWHGAGWNFALWGALHGGYLIVNRLCRNRLRRLPAVGHVLTLLAVAFAWLPFYEARTAVLWLKLRALVRPEAYAGGRLTEAARHWTPGDRLTMGTFAALAVVMLVAEGFSLRAGGEPYSRLLRRPVLLALVVITVFVAPGVNNGFVYFAF